MNITVIGTGNVGIHLGRALKQAGHDIKEVNSRSPEQVSERADVYIVAVKDDALETVIAQLNLDQQLLLHTSGTASLDVLANHSENHGVLYPLQTLSKDQPVNYSELVLCIEANNTQSLQDVENLATGITQNVHEVTSQQRMVLHVAAVFACNFTNHLYAIAEQVVTAEGLSFDLLKPLIRETAGKASELGPATAQTGPAARGDRKVMSRHLEFLSRYPEYQHLYERLSDDIMKHAEDINQA